MIETIPWNWQDTATIIGCVSILLLAFWIRRRLLKTGSAAAGGCNGCASNEDAATPRGPAPPLLIPTNALSIGRRKKA